MKVLYQFGTGRVTQVIFVLIPKRFCVKLPNRESDHLGGDMIYLVLALVASFVLRLAGIPWLASLEAYTLFVAPHYLLRRKGESHSPIWYITVMAMGAYTATMISHYNTQFDAVRLFVAGMISMSVSIIGFAILNRLSITAREERN